MPLSLTAAPVYTTTQVIAPEDGDDLDAADSATALQLLANRVAFARFAVEGLLLWSGDFSVAPGGSLTSFSVTVGAILALVAADSASTLRVGTNAATTIGVSKVEGTPGTLGAQARWWYVYGFVKTDGTVDYAISLTPPDPTRRFKGGDPTRVYLGCFPTDTTGAPYPLRAMRGRYLYQRSAVTSVLSLTGANGLRVLSRSAAQSSFTAVDLTPVVPPHARVAMLELTAIGDNAPDTATLTVYSDTDTASAGATADTLDNHPAVVRVEMITGANQQVRYKLAHLGSGGIDGYIDAVGFAE